MCQYTLLGMSASEVSDMLVLVHMQCILPNITRIFLMLATSELMNIRNLSVGRDLSKCDHKSTCKWADEHQSLCYL